MWYFRHFSCNSTLSVTPDCYQEVILFLLQNINYFLSLVTYFISYCLLAIFGFLSDPILMGIVRFFCKTTLSLTRQCYLPVELFFAKFVSYSQIFLVCFEVYYIMLHKLMPVCGISVIFDAIQHSLSPQTATRK